jgi:hypothetical protein
MEKGQERLDFARLAQSVESFARHPAIHCFSREDIFSALPFCAAVVLETAVVEADP